MLLKNKGIKRKNIKFLILNCILSTLPTTFVKVQAYSPTNLVRLIIIAFTWYHFF